MSENKAKVQWQTITVTSPHIKDPLEVVAAKNIPYFPNANKLQNLNLYLPKTAETSALVGHQVTSLPGLSTQHSQPTWLVHIHGGAWRDATLTASSVEAAVAHAFSGKDAPLQGIAALNYTLSPTQHPKFHPYDPVKDNHAHPEREATHPKHVSDILHGFQLLRSLGLTDGSFILSGHSAGACLGCQATLQAPSHYRLDDVPDAPRPAAFIGLNGLYDLEQLVHGLGPSHAQLKTDYDNFLSIAFGADQTKWPSPARFDADDVAERVRQGKAPPIMLFDESTADQLVPMNQRDRMRLQMEQVGEIKVVVGQRCVGSHSAPWEEGYMIWESVLDVLAIMKEDK